MGSVRTARFLARGARNKGRSWAFRKLAPQFKQWDMMRNMLNHLVKFQRIETTLPRAKELQQYAEEIVFLAKKNTAFHDGLVESIVTSSEARQILYERLVPRYRERHFHFTRLLNTLEYRERDTAPMGILEYIDRPGELRPANPVGVARMQHVAQQFLATRRGRRKHLGEMKKILKLPDAPLDQRVLQQCSFECAKFDTD